MMFEVESIMIFVQLLWYCYKKIFIDRNTHIDDLMIIYERYMISLFYDDSYDSDLYDSSKQNQ